METGQHLRRGRRRAERQAAGDPERGQGQGFPDPRHRPRHGRRLHPQHPQRRQELQPRGSVDGRLPGDAPGRAADAGCGAGPVPRPVLRFGALRPLRRRPRQDEHAPRPQDRGYRAHAAQGGHPPRHQDAGRPARRQGRDRRHRPPRQPARALGRRADGEPVPPGPPAHGARHQGAHELGRHRHGDAAGPDQRQAGGGRRARVLRLLAALPVHGPDQPALRDHAQAAAVGAGSGRPHPRARGLRGARRAPHALRPHLPDRDAGGAQHRPHQLARHLRSRQQVRLHREPLPQGREGQGDRPGHLSLGHGGGALSRGPGQRRRSTPRAS